MDFSSEQCYSLYEEVLMSLLCKGHWVGEVVGEEMEDEKEEVRLLRCILNSAVRK